MDIHSPGSANRLLTELSAAEAALLAPNLKRTHIAQGVLLHEAGDLMEQVYFPLSGMISVLAVMRNGSAIETATVGNEGAVNTMVGLGASHSPGRSVMQVAGEVFVISAAKFRAVVETSSAARHLFARHSQAQLGNAQQTAACNALHTIEQRFCR